MNKNEAFHGSDLEKVEQVYGIKKEEIINFAANVNPLGLSTKLTRHLQEHIDVLTSYPDRDYIALRESIANYTGAQVSNILVGNGATEIIGFMAQFINPKKALIIAPTYSEYAREVGLSGGQVDYFLLREEDNFILNLKELDKELTKKYDMLILCNPNNPTSDALKQPQLIKLLKSCKKYGTFVMIDETYVEFSPNYEEITAIPLVEDFHNFIVLRGTSKFYAAPGLRLGYAVTGNDSLIRMINEQRNPWTINSMANEAGIHMFEDQDFIESTETLIHKEQIRMFQLFDQCDLFTAYPPSANFLLLKILNNKLSSTDYFERAIKKGFMIRDCSNFVGLDNHYIRFCFMNPDDNDRLAALLLQTD